MARVDGFAIYLQGVALVQLLGGVRETVALSRWRLGFADMLLMGRGQAPRAASWQRSEDVVARWGQRQSWARHAALRSYPSSGPKQGLRPATLQGQESLWTCFRPVAACSTGSGFSVGPASALQAAQLFSSTLLEQYVSQ